MRLLLVAVVVLAITLPALSLPNHVLDSVFTSRSGQIALGYASDDVFFSQRQASSTLFFSNPLSSPLSMPSIRDTHVADLLASSLGLSPLRMDSSIDRTGYPKASFFSKPAAAFVAVIGHADAAQLAFPQFSSTQVLPSYITESPLSTLETIFSAATPSSHGIVADSWFSDRTEVHVGNSDALPTLPSLADWVANSESRSLVLTAAHDTKLAATLATSSAHPNSRRFTGAFDAQQLSSFLPSSVKVQPQDGVVLLSEGTLQASFRLADQADQSFLNEVSSLISMVEALLSSSSELSASVQDEFPDLISVGFSSLGSFLPQSAKATLAAKLIQLAISTASDRLAAGYSGRLVSAVVAIHPVLPAAVRASCSALAQQEWLSEVSSAPLTHTCPELYISQSLSDEQIRKLSAQIASAISSQGVSSYVLPERRFLSFFTRDSNSTIGNSTDSGPTSDEMAMFQITLWTSIALFLTLVAILSSMFCLTWEGYDSQVFIESTTVQRNMINGYKE